MVQKYKTSERSMIMIPMKYICLLILALIFGSHDNCLSHLNASISPNDTSDIVSQDLICVKLDGEKSKILTITEKTNALTINADIEVSWYRVRLKEVRIEEAKKRMSIFNGYEIRLKNNTHMNSVHYCEEGLNEDDRKEKTWIVTWDVFYECIFKYGILPFEHKRGFGSTNGRTFNVTK